MGRARLAGVAAALLTLSALAAGAGAQVPLVGSLDVDFVHPGPQALKLPTAVAVGPEGQVYVADGVNDRIVEFAADGVLRAEIGGVGEAALSRPLSVKAGPAGELWILDTGNGRILVRGPAGELVRTIPVGPPAGGAVPDLTDLAFDPVRNALWVVDNDNHSVLRLDLEAEQWQSVGGLGGGLGQFHYPFMLALRQNGDACATDVINGRGVVLSSATRPVRALGSYGVHLGQFYRPKGIAVDGGDRVWVSDGVLGVVQAFHGDGAFIDVLRNEAGEPLPFETPVGLAFDKKGRLYVVELEAGRVRRVQIQTAAVAAPAPTERPVIASPQPQICTACHFEWMSPLADGRATELAAPPPNPPQNPYVSTSRSCLSCHDGSVVDSRRRVWLEHGHRTGVTPPPEMEVPPRLPLVAGELVCRTCHSAHTRGGSGSLLRDAVFLRVREQPGELCTSCHAEYAGGADRGMHPLGDMAMAIPAALARWAEQAERRAVTCMSCHTGHGARADHLLVLSPNHNELCLACHADLQPALFNDATRSRHGRLPVLTIEQRAVADSFQTRIAPDGRLLCTTCHRAHAAPSRANLLAFEPTVRDVCGACHAAQRRIVGSSHDLRTAWPDALNVLGVVASEAGACGSCHTAHQFAQPVLPTVLDPHGTCMTCHDAGRLASSELTEVNHPQATCRECHDPHDPSHRAFLPAPPVNVCQSCHPDQLQLASGPHDMFREPAAWPVAALATADPCLACHRVHGTRATGLARVPPEDGGVAGGASCLGCHPDAGRGAASRIALVHPEGSGDLLPVAALPLQDGSGTDPVITCVTCHDPHRGGPVSPKLLRLGDVAGSAEVCTTCHIEQANISAIGHAQPLLRAAGLDAHTCEPCHLVHASPAAIQPPLWPIDLLPPEIPEHPRNRYCRACHRAGGRAPEPAVTSHPEVQMLNTQPPGAPGYLPLFDQNGAQASDGSLACETCHLTHGRSTPAAVAPELGELSVRELRARQWHLRSFAGSNLCTTCHGFDALRRFIYFHDPARRGGPIETAPRPG